MSVPPTAPQAMRGCWYQLAQPVNDAVTSDDADEVLCFGVDGSYVRYKLKGQRRKEAEHGDYTYDGSFLILRARRTHTFRVKRQSFWRWNLEGKKKSYALMRGFLPDGQVDKLPKEESRDIRLIPVRARVEPHFDDGEDLFRLVYEHGDRDRRCLATFCVDRAAEDHLWVGITPFVEGIEERTWKRIIDESYLDAFLDSTSRPEKTTVHLLNAQ